jgi:hypothetical protein
MTLQYMAGERTLLLHCTDVRLAAFNEPQRPSLCAISPFEREVAKQVTENRAPPPVAPPRWLRHDRPMFTVGRSYELTFSLAPAKQQPASKILDISLPLIKVRDEKGVELVINASSAGLYRRRS